MTRLTPPSSTPMSDDIDKRATELFNSLSDDDRKNKAGLGYALAQLTTIKQQRQANKEMIAREDRRLADWQKNVERHIEQDYLSAPQQSTSPDKEQKE